MDLAEVDSLVASLGYLSRADETFASLFASGVPAKEAYENAYLTSPEECDLVEVLSNPFVKERIKKIVEALDATVVLSLKAHVDELARVRNLARDYASQYPRQAGSLMRVALEAEIKRGEIGGHYNGKNVHKLPALQKAITINFVKSAPATLPAVESDILEGTSVRIEEIEE